MKRLVLMGLLIAVVFTSVSSAEQLVTANPLGQGKWGILGAYLSDANASNVSGYTIGTIGGYVGYGLTDKLGLFFTGASANMNGLPAGLSAAYTAIGLAVKYTLLEEGASSPVSVAVGVGYKSLNYTMSAALGGNTTGSQIGAGVLVSKVIAPFVPYAGLQYRKSTQAGADLSTQLDPTIGTVIAWSEQGGVYLEYTMQSITPTGGAAYTSGQMAAGVGYAL